jgi:hypothetical protein
MVGEGDARAIPLKILSGRVHYLHDVRNWLNSVAVLMVGVHYLHDVRNYEGKINGFIVTGELAY